MELSHFFWLKWMQRLSKSASKTAYKGISYLFIARMEHGIITNYKYYEETVNSGHFYEITIEEDEKCYYVKSERGAAVSFGTEVVINPQLKVAHFNSSAFPITGPFEKNLNIINYQGFVIDCLDSDIGVYNLDNEIFLFGSGCLDLPIGVNVTLFNLHLVHMTDMNWIFKLFGRNLKKSSHILVYCPAFSSYLEGSDTVSYDNLINTKTNLFSLIYANKWLKDNFKIDFPGFNSLDNFASVLFSENQSKGSAEFIGHCEKCAFTQNFTELTEFKKLVTSQNVKDSFHKIKGELQETSAFSNQILSKYLWMRNEIVHGIITRKNSVLFDIVSDDKSVSIYSNESSGFNPPDGSFVLIVNAIQIVEMVPKLRSSNSWTTKAYLWISPETKVWSPSDYFWAPSLNFSCPNGFILCKIVRKYLILKEFDQKLHETTVIHVESEKGPHCFYLNPNEKYYAILSTNEEAEEGLLSLRHCVNEIYFKESNEPMILPSSGIVPWLSCTLEIDEPALLKGPLQVRLTDLPYLSLIKSLQFFAVKLRFYSISSLSLRLICSKCKSQIESGRCLTHFEAYSPVLIVSAVFEAADLDASTTTILIDRFSFFETILGTKNNFKTDLINLLKFPGKVKLNSDHLSFSISFKPTAALDGQQPSLEHSVSNLIPRVSRIINCTFPSNMANSVLKPVNLEYCDPKIELINILKLF